MPNVDLSPVEMDGRNQSEFAPADVEYREFSDLICGPKDGSHIGEGSPGRLFRDSNPSTQRYFRIAASGPERSQLFLGNDVHKAFAYRTGPTRLYFAERE
jgi:hypothetical protein